MAQDGREDTFLTVAEVAELLKLNQQTVRNWIDQGSMPAIRIGRRVRIRRSDLDRVLDRGYQGGTAPGPPLEGPSADDFWSGELVGAAELTTGGNSGTTAMSFGDDLVREREQAMRLVKHASTSWAEAMRAHKLAPPDAGFARRLHALAEAAATEQVAWEQAHAAGLMWRPIPGAEHAAPPYELRPGTGRRGPQELWVRFDAAVTALNEAIAGSSAAAVAAAFGVMAAATAELADAVDREDAIAREAHERARSKAA